MFVDASALVSILLEENDFAIFAAQLERSDQSHVTPFVTMEVGLALLRETPSDAALAYADIEQMLNHFRIRSTELTADMVLVALQAYERYGKGRGHPARLNMGDCMSYGAAKVLGLPLLYKGGDFSKTDIPAAAPA
jgi:ribonuclease VapC